ncbi:HAD family phosphatase [Pseudomonas fuscovaginae UPB0736]|uniref:phosphonoacetaldehyde phosphohydrolase-related protein n=1 Tax=Pseudomonas asplenii TaxID=53407 RepID=UPI000289312D|nr:MULTISPECIES: phosphonoacetaldehyde phosphohydrolase-related protein [Pseudomonas]UUQ64213.1 HAD family phosphatase [Pseudomonas fuscovaginae UPB0736]UZE27290.1 HAD family phosphatase [Pseudomonas asplenii]
MPLTAAAPLPTPTALLFGLTGCLVDFGARARPGQRVDEHRHATPGALEVLQDLKQLGVPCAWMDELPHEVSLPLAATLPGWIKPAGVAQHARWPAPNACWQALMELGVQQLEGCVLVSGEPRLLQSGLNAGLWTIGLASCGPLCGLTPLEWQALSREEREKKRGKATLALFSLGVHSVIDHLGELSTCLTDIAQRRLKGEKP